MCWKLEGNEVSISEEQGGEVRIGQRDWKDEETTERGQ